MKYKLDRFSYERRQNNQKLEAKPSNQSKFYSHIEKSFPANKDDEDKQQVTPTKKYDYLFILISNQQFNQVIDINKQDNIQKHHFLTKIVFIHNNTNMDEIKILLNKFEDQMCLNINIEFPNECYFVKDLYQFTEAI